jgi:hypothetical protein
MIVGDIPKPIGPLNTEESEWGTAAGEWIYKAFSAVGCFILALCGVLILAFLVGYGAAAGWYLFQTTVM